MSEEWIGQRMVESPLVRRKLRQWNLRKGMSEKGNSFNPSSTATSAEVLPGVLQCGGIVARSTVSELR